MHKRHTSIHINQMQPRNRPTQQQCSRPSHLTSHAHNHMRKLVTLLQLPTVTSPPAPFATETAGQACETVNFLEKQPERRPKTHKIQTLNPDSQTPNSIPQTPNHKPQIPNLKPQTPNLYVTDAGIRRHDSNACSRFETAVHG